MLRVPRPRVESVRRSAAGRASIGDESVVVAGPGLLALLEHPIAGGHTALGAGYHGRHNVPFGLAISAALALVEPATPAGSWWVGREATLEWLALPGVDDTLYGEARLIALSERDALFAIAARTGGGAALLRGDFLLARVAGGRSIGYPTGAGERSSLSERARERRAATATSPRVRSAPTVLPLGRSAEVIVEVTAPPGNAATWALAASPPPARGLSVESPAERSVTVAGGTSAAVSFIVRADRPHAINDGEPWILELRATRDGHAETLTVAIAVPDSDRPAGRDPLDARDDTTPALIAWTAPEPCAADLSRRTLTFPVRLLGRGIRVDADRPAEVTVAAPEGLDRGAIAGMRVVQGGQVLGTGAPTVGVTVRDREVPLELDVELTPKGVSSVAGRLTAAGVPPLRERSEPASPDLLRLRPPRVAGTAGTYRVSPDVARLLLNPVAGHGEPIGRRVHPLSGVGVGASLTAAFGLAGEPDPAEPVGRRAAALWMRWLTLPDLDFDLEARARLQSSADGGHTVRVDVVDAWGRRATESEIVIAAAPGASGPAAVAALLARRRIERASPSPPATPAADSPLARIRTRLGDLWHRFTAPGEGGRSPG